MLPRNMEKSKTLKIITFTKHSFQRMNTLLEQAQQNRNELA